MHVLCTGLVVSASLGIHTIVSYPSDRSGRVAVSLEKMFGEKILCAADRLGCPPPKAGSRAAVLAIGGPR